MAKSVYKYIKCPFKIMCNVCLFIVMNMGEQPMEDWKKMTKYIGSSFEGKCLGNKGRY